MKMKTRIQNKETFKRVLFWSSMVICLLLTGCVTKSKSVNYFSSGVGYYTKDDYDGAIFYFTKDIEINPERAKAFASSHGNQTTTVIIDGKPVIVGLNAYIKK